MASLSLRQLTQSPHGEMKVDADGVPLYAQPWLRLGRLQEKEKWQYFALDRTEAGIFSEMQSMRSGVAEVLPKTFSEAACNKIDASYAKIVSLFKEHKKLVGMEKESKETVPSMALTTVPLEKVQTKAITTTSIVPPKAATDISDSAMKASATAAGLPGPAEAPNLSSVPTPPSSEPPSSAPPVAPTPQLKPSVSMKPTQEGKLPTQSSTPAPPPPDQQPTKPPVAQPSFRYPFFGGSTDRRPPARRLTMSRPATE